MFYRMIERKRDQWFAADDCTVRTLVDFISNSGQMRDAQVDAIKTYLFLKVGDAVFTIRQTVFDHIEHRLSKGDKEYCSLYK